MSARRRPGDAPRSTARDAAIEVRPSGDFFWRVLKGVFSPRLREYVTEVLRQSSILISGSVIIGSGSSSRSAS